MIRILKEIIGPKERCTNIALESFGLCYDKPIMNKAQIYVELKKYFNIYEYINIEDYTTNLIYLQAQPIDNYSKKLGKKILSKKVSTVKRFIDYLKVNNIEGHFIIYIRDHVIALHKINNRIFIVDAEEVFDSSKHIQGIYVIEDPDLDMIFKNFVKNTNKVDKIEAL